MSTPFRALALAAGLVLAAVALAAEPVAFLSDVKGEVVMNGAGGRPPLLSELVPGTTLRLGKDAAAAVMYVVSGEEFSLRGPGEYVVAREGVRASQGAAPPSRVPSLRPSATSFVDTSRTATASVRMRSVAAPKAKGATPVYPVDTRIATLQPALRWTGDPGGPATLVMTSDTGEEVYRGPVRGRSLALPAKLQPGRSYTWTLAVEGKDPVDVRFETLPADSIAAAEKARTGARSFRDRVLYALVLQDLGAAQDAREVWRHLAAERPDLPELAKLAR